MKILRIRFKNLHSLRVAREVDFTAEPFASAGLFAITGDTGAGKTTLTDALTLALFGKTPRQKNDRYNELEVMSWGSDEASAEVEFEVGGKIYRSRWLQEREKKDPKKKKTTLELVELTENGPQNLADRASELKSTTKEKGLVEQICGLNFEQFSKTVLLPQGDFSEFLIGDEKKRSEILERLTDADIFSKLSQASFRREKEERLALDLLARDLLKMEELMTEPVADLREKRAVIELENTGFSEKMAALRANIAWLDRLEILEKQRIELENEQAVFEKNRLAIQAELARLADHQRGLPLKNSMLRLDELATQKTGLQAEIAQNQSEIDRLTAEIVGLTEKKSAAAAAFQSQKKEAAASEILFEKVAALDLQLVAQQKTTDAARLELEEITARLTALESDFSEKKQAADFLKTTLAETSAWLLENARLEPLAARLPAIEQQLDNWKNWLAEGRDGLRTELEFVKKSLFQEKKEADELAAELARNRTQLIDFQQTAAKLLALIGLAESRSPIAELTDLIEKNVAMAKALEILESTARRHWELLARLSELRDEQENSLFELASLDLKMLSAVEFSAEMEAILAFKKAIFEQQQRLANYDRDRSALADGEACPLCGSLEHPFSMHGFEVFVDESRAEFEQAEARFRTAKQAENGLLIQVRELEKSLEGLRRMSDLHQQANHFEEEMAKLLPDLAAEIWQSASFEKLASQLTETVQLLENQKFVRENLRQIETDSREIQAKISQAEAREAALKIQISANGATVERLEKRLAEVREKFAAGQKWLADDFAVFGLVFSAKTGETADADFQKLKNQSAIFEEKKRAETGIETALKLAENEWTSLEKQRIEFQKISFRRSEEFKTASLILEKLTAERHSLFENGDLKTAREALKSALEMAEKNSQLAENQWNASQVQLADLSGKIQVISQNFESAHQQFGQLADRFSVDLATAGFASPDELRAAILSENEVAELKNRRADFQKKDTELASRAAEIQARFAAESASPHPILELVEARQNLSETETLAIARQRESGILDQRILHRESQEDAATELMQRIDNQRLEHRRWKNLADLIGSEGGQKFRVFAQGITLERLVELANFHLETLQEGRYKIRKRPDDKSLDLEIIDALQADHARPMKTLSGGEIFLVSLALALGLGDLAGAKTEIRSLFIDEGFGSLDENSLQQAMDTLEGLQRRSVQIGIISHVKELKEGIFPQIRVVKKGNGVSDIEIVANGER